MAVGRLVREVCSVQGEQERAQDCCLWGHCTADTQSSHTMASKWGSRGSRTWGAGPLPWAPAGPPKAQAVWCCKYESKNMILTVLPGFYKWDSDCPGDRWCRRPPRPLGSLGWGVRYSGSLRGWFCIFPSFVFFWLGSSALFCCFHGFLLGNYLINLVHWFPRCLVSFMCCILQPLWALVLKYLSGGHNTC